MDADGSAVEYHGVLYDGEAQSGATHLARATLVHTIEALEEALQVFGSHPHSIVGEAEMPLAVVLYVGLDELCRERYGGTYAGDAMALSVRLRKML